MGCVQILVHQCGKMKGLRFIAAHFCNLLLVGCLQVKGKTCIVYFAQPCCHYGYHPTMLLYTD